MVLMYGIAFVVLIIVLLFLLINRGLDEAGIVS